MLGFAVPVVVSLGLLYLLYRHVDFHQLVSSVASAKLFWGIMYVVLSSVEPFIRGLRWSYLVRSSSGMQAVKGLYIAKAGNNILPFRMGDAVRTQYIRDRAGIPYTTSAASIIAETALDLVMLGFLVLVFTILVASSRGMLLSLILLAGIPAFLLLMTRGKSMLPRFLRGSRLFTVAGMLAERLRLIVSDRNRFSVLGVSVLLWCVTLSASYAGLRMFLPHAGFMGVLSAIVFVYFSVLVPSAPGFVGTYHAALAGTLSIMGYSIAEYPALPIVLHLLQLLPQTLIGLFFGIRYIFSNNWRQALDGLKAARAKLMSGPPKQ